MIINSKGGGRPGMMPVGMHRAKIQRITQKEGSNVCVVVFLGLDEEAANTECVDFINLDAAEWRVRLIYEAATGDRYPAEGQSWDTQTLIDREVMIECEHRVNPNTNETQARASRIYPVA